LRKYGDEQKKGRLTLADETLEYLLLYSWPGNVRQLANEVRRMVAMAEADSALTPTLLSPRSRRHAGRFRPPPSVEPEVRVANRSAAACRGGATRADDGQECARQDARTRRRSRAHPGHFAKRVVPETRRWGLSLQHHSERPGLSAPAFAVVAEDDPRFALLVVVGRDVRGRPLSELIDVDRADTSRE
jgi:hypothetical protein